MGSVNKAILVGNLGRDAEMRFTSGGTHAFLDRLEAYLTGDELPNWAARRLEVNQRAQHLEAN